MRSTSLSLAVLVLLACGRPPEDHDPDHDPPPAQPEPPLPPDAGSPPVTPAPDAGAAGAGPDAGCAIGLAPGALPPIQSSFLRLGMNAVPPPTGGDPSGTWVAHQVRVYVPATLPVNAMASSATGTGWARLDDGGFELSLDLDLQLMVGTSPIHQVVKRQGVGRYTVSGVQLQLAGACGPTQMGVTEFSAQPGAFQLQLKSTQGVAAGMVTVIDMRVP